MKVLYDTSVLIPAFISGHEHHSLSFPQVNLAKRDDVQGYLSSHSLAEFYATTTRIPKPLRLSSDEAYATILRFLKYLTPVELSAKDYRKAITRTTKMGLAGGVMYDAVIAQAALKAGVEQLITLNSKDFKRLGDEVSKIVYVPKA